MVKIIHEPTSFFFFLLVCSAELWVCSMTLFMILFHDSVHDPVPWFCSWLCSWFCSWSCSMILFMTLSMILFMILFHDSVHDSVPWFCSMTLFMILFQESVPSTRPIKDVLLWRSPHRMFSVSHSNLINAVRPMYPPAPPQNKNSSDLHYPRGWPILISKRRISPKGDTFAGMRFHQAAWMSCGDSLLKGDLC